MDTILILISITYVYRNPGVYNGTYASYEIHAKENHITNYISKETSTSSFMLMACVEFRTSTIRFQDMLPSHKHGYDVAQ